MLLTYSTDYGRALRNDQVVRTVDTAGFQQAFEAALHTAGEVAPLLARKPSLEGGDHHFMQVKTFGLMGEIHHEPVEVQKAGQSDSEHETLLNWER